MVQAGYDPLPQSVDRLRFRLEFEQFSVEDGYSIPGASNGLRRCPGWTKATWGALARASRLASGLAFSSHTEDGRKSCCALLDLSAPNLEGPGIGLSAGEGLDAFCQGIIALLFYLSNVNA
jgi:hypothetical protein